MSEPVIKISNVVKEFMVGARPIRILKDLNLDIQTGEFVMIVGPSGCGKSTFLNVINGWENPTEGNVSINGVEIYKKTEDQRAKMRHHLMSFVHQTSSWVKSENVILNIAMPYLLAGRDKKSALQRSMELLKMLHLDHYANYKPMDLSGGQQQRISFLRALVNNPEIILADEPTGNLDTSSSQVFMNLFCKINEELGRTIVMVTHNMDLLKYATKTVVIIDGAISSVEQNKDKCVDASKIIHKDVLELAFGHFNDVDEEDERERSKIR